MFSGENSAGEDRDCAVLTCNCASTLVERLQRVVDKYAQFAPKLNHWIEQNILERLTV